MNNDAKFILYINNNHFNIILYKNINIIYDYSSNINEKNN